MAAIDIDDLRAGAAGAPLAIELVDRIASTNRQLVDAPFGRAPAVPRLLVARLQTTGRGRRGREWLMEPGRSAAFSIALERSVQDGTPALGLPIAVGVSAVEALAAQVPGLRLKWPNDLQRGGRKLGGILVESRRGAAADGAPLERFVVGIGLNLLAPEDAGERIGQPVAGLFEREPLPEPAGVLVGRVAASVLAGAVRFLEDGLAPFRAAWQLLDALAGQAVDVLAEGRIEASGIACGIDEHGGLLLETAQGLRSIRSGEVSVRSTARAAAGAIH